jgi:hypothetical protein
VNVCCLTRRSITKNRENILIINDDNVIVLRRRASLGIPSVPVFVLDNWRITDRLDVGQIIMEADYDWKAGRDAE